VGLDGLNENDVAQTGVDAYAGCSNQGSDAWIEWFPGPAAEVFTIAPGDDIYATVNTKSSTSVQVYIKDSTSETSFSGTITAPHGTKLVANEAEDTVQRPGGDQNTKIIYTRWLTTSGPYGISRARRR
jgi:hypothetical protein